MPLHTVPAPAPALQAVLAALNSPSATRGAPTLHNSPGPVTTTLAHPVHVLDVPDEAVGSRCALTSTRCTGWRFLINAGETPIASAETVRTPDGWAFSHFSQGPFVTSTHLAMRQAHTLPTRYQPRLLSVPGLYMLALWLHNDSSADSANDLLIPLAPAPLGIPAHHPHKATELLSALTRRLTHRITPSPAVLTTTALTSTA
ncbi:hypothetical protein [Wenjunlia tyrosinilytica]|uniref:Uncharacterized protein n=1 Tax=Wenjunlia tyrosinilytica TaxID=1544741 RepID=A0A917ZJW2_9ACTN|nr:hypothetical protein [Wenjunlia tyrosinilytica]GGO84513.1 hypothetical protein GCM10012280_16170 [Wenjunlia tyrosinilytica]